jgi:trans-2,3-dihydro-3-hydroxyanthranilate isomerase
MMKRRFFTLDVFTDKALCGNPLAVVLDSDGLDSDMMQRIAGEFNLSETVFVMPPEDKNNRAKIRIFTPGRELPFAGHPTVGTAVLLSHLDGLGDGAELVLEENVGLVPCRVSANSASFELPKLPERKEADLDVQLMAKTLGLAPSDIGIEGHSFAACNAGVPFPTLPLASLKALQSIHLNAPLLTQHNVPRGLEDEIYVYSKETLATDADYQARMFAPAMGIPEDPATGSAVAGLAGQIMACEKPEDGEHRFVIDQGIEMGRPSRILLDLFVEGGQLKSASIAGDAVIVSEGILNL